MSSIEKALEIYVTKARRWLELAREALAMEYYDQAVGDAYRCVESCIRALLLSRGVKRLPKTHGGLLQLFAYYFIDTELLPKELASNINKLLRMRKNADYESVLVDAEDARFAVEVAQNMLEKTINYLSNRIIPEKEEKENERE